MSAALVASVPEQRVAELYAGPLDDFVRRRDALAKELRAAGDRDGAAAVKALRKPSRHAWALDRAAAGDGIEPLVAAVAATIDAQSRSQDVRGAMARLREAVRAFAALAADAARDAGYGLDAAELGNAVLAVLGQPDSFARLRAGSLAEVPEGGGLEVLASLPAPRSADGGEAAASERAAADAHRDPGRPGGKSSGQRGRDTARAQAAERTAKALARARERTEAAQTKLREAESQVREAEARLAAAEAQAQAARRRLADVRAEAEAAAAQLAASERAAADLGEA